MGTKHQPLAFVSVSDLIRDKSINAGTEHQACYHPFVISTSFMTPDHEDEENVKEDHDDLDTIDECYEYTKNMSRGARMKTVPNDPNKLLGDGTIKKVSPETIKNSGSPTATSQQAGEFLENCSLVMSHQRPGRDTRLTPRPTSKVSREWRHQRRCEGFVFLLPCKLFSTKVHCSAIFANEVRNNSHADNVCLLGLSSQPWK